MDTLFPYDQDRENFELVVEFAKTLDVPLGFRPQTDRFWRKAPIMYGNAVTATTDGAVWFNPSACAKKLNGQKPENSNINRRICATAETKTDNAEKGVAASVRRV